MQTGRAGGLVDAAAPGLTPGPRRRGHTGVPRCFHTTAGPTCWTERPRTRPCGRPQGATWRALHARPRGTADAHASATPWLRLRCACTAACARGRLPPGQVPAAPHSPAPLLRVAHGSRATLPAQTRWSGERGRPDARGAHRGLRPISRAAEAALVPEHQRAPACTSVHQRCTSTSAGSTATPTRIALAARSGTQEVRERRDGGPGRERRHRASDLSAGSGPA
jgi:hypothetical protein